MVRPRNTKKYIFGLSPGQPKIWLFIDERKRFKYATGYLNKEA